MLGVDAVAMDAGTIMDSWHSVAPRGRSDGDVAERALARARAAMAAVDSAEVGTPPPLLARARVREPVAASPSRLRAVVDAMGQQQQRAARPVALIESIRAMQTELSALSDGNASWVATAHLLQQEPRLITQPVVGELLDRQLNLQMQLDSASLPHATPSPVGPKPTFHPGHRSSGGSVFFSRIDDTPQLQAPGDETARVPPREMPKVPALANTSLTTTDGTQLASTEVSNPSGTGADIGKTMQAHPVAAMARAEAEAEVERGPEPEPEPEPELEPTGTYADSQIAGTDRVTPRAIGGTAALRWWQRWLSHLQRRIEARLLRTVVHAWRVCTATQSARREGILRAVEQQQSRTITAVKRQALQQWRAAEQEQALRHRHRASVAKRRQSQSYKRLLREAMRSWRQAASSGALHRQLSLFQAMHSAAEQSSAAERSLRVAAEAELQQLRGQLAESERELAVQLAPERERNEALRERVRLLAAAAETFEERQEHAAQLLREALAARQDAFLEKSAALARASSSREAELARAAELKAAKRALLVATRTLEACEAHGLVRRASSGAIEVCEIPVTTAAPEASSRGKAPPRGLLQKTAQASSTVASDDRTGDGHDED